MQMYIATEQECRAVTADLQEAPPDTDFDTFKLTKNPQGPMPIEQMNQICDGYHLGYMGIAGSRLKLGGIDLVCFMIAGIMAFGVVTAGMTEGNNAFPWLNDEYGWFMWCIWIAGFFFFFLALWVRQLAKKDGFSYIIFSREYGTVTFPKVETDESLTVLFEDVELSVFRTIHTMGTHQWHTIIRTKTCRPGHRPRKEGISLYGSNKEEFQQEWNMIARFMDPTLSMPACLHTAITEYQKQEKDVWGETFSKPRTHY
ncbi:hypothetical protein [Gynuella sunshinyii]|uniref:Uncharacterized protein n=1 Tax=Gynuella sunshinyii YC6258 TaxID=1445510 RepID=A0A0C5VC22_9GAMM|nr:hypothetical protein [Gynuella sunshinyii]AJQ92062.1 hypothetical Protein YC6258_00006 [Gynuella sunshinyii YC6258]